ncbi:MAG: tripartite tricarboxylate transporter TctB family protein [Rhodobacterales bacterium]|nr:tripartite tricarboxylate transporter TctB family protein [Rhodobacterales bacterium]
MNSSELAGGAVLIVTGLMFSFASLSGLEIGTAYRMGPGSFPMVLGGLLAVLGLVLVVRSARVSSPPQAAFPWRGVVLTCLGPILFGLTVRGLGLAPTLLLATGLAALASREMTPRRFLLTVGGVTLFCVAVFKFALGLPVVLIGPWLGGV